MSWESLRGDGVAYRPSPLESRRFGMAVGRLLVGNDTRDAEAAGRALTRRLREAEEDLVIARWPHRMTRLGVAALASGRTIIPADVLTYWELTPDRQVRQAGAHDLTLSEAGGADDVTLRLVESIVAASFNGYTNHYSANPLLSAEAALAGYVEWAQGCLADPARDVLVASREGAPVGLATLERNENGSDLEVLLCGLVPEAQGRGLYSPLLHGVAGFAQEHGASRTIISTQVHNTRAQRVWAALGFRPFAAVATVHAVAARLGSIGHG